MSWWDPTRPSPAERPALALASGPPELPLMSSPPRREHFRSASLQTAPLGNGRFPLRVRLSARTRLPLRPGRERARSRRSTSEAWTQTGAKPSHGHLPKPLPEDSIRKKMHAPPGTWELGAHGLLGRKQEAQAEGIPARPEPRMALPGKALLSSGLSVSSEEMMGLE